MSLNQLTNPAQANWPVVVNENLAAAGVELYAYNYQTTTGLTEGGYGGNYGTTAISPWTVVLTASDTNYIVAHRTTGAVTASVATTNWDDTTTYGRIRQNVTNGSGTTSRIDWRFLDGGIFDNSAAPGAVDATNVTYTPADLADWVGSADPGDVSDALDQLADRLTGIAGSGASTTQTGEMMSGYIGTVADKDYKIVVKAAHGGTITETTTISESGTATFTFKVNSTPLGGTANSVSTGEQSQAHASANTFSADDDIVITASSNSSCVGASFTIKYTRTLA